MTDELREAIRKVVNDVMPDSAGDVELMREALEVLGTLDKWLTGGVTAIRCPVCGNSVVPWHVAVCTGARAAITKLEERLLNE